MYYFLVVILRILNLKNKILEVMGLGEISVQQGRACWWSAACGE
jgi:hypothetical protein